MTGTEIIYDAIEKLKKGELMRKEVTTYEFNVRGRVKVTIPGGEDDNLALKKALQAAKEEIDIDWLEFDGNETYPDYDREIEREMREENNG